jgi:membrane peptidoglycan carboxypeptidase
MARAPIHELEWRERRSRWFVALAVLLSIAVLASTWVALFSFLGVNTAYGVFQGLEEKYRPDTAAMELALPDLSQVSRIYSGDDLLLAELHDGRFSEPTRIGDVPKRVVNAILASEDGRFFEHEGVDWRSFGRALFENVIGRSDQGGSTITQQVAKVFVGNEITAERKIREMFVSVELERRYTKRQILEFYLNSVYFGWSAYGIKAAAREYFGKELADLTLAEGAALSVLIRNPSLYDLRRRPDNAIEKRNATLERMVELGFIKRAQARKAKKVPLEVIDHQPFVGPAEHVVAEVKRQLLNDPEFAFLGRTAEERKQAVFGCPGDVVECDGGGGLRIETTIDMGLQQYANSMLREWLPPSTDPDNPTPTGAIAMVDNSTGATKVIASGLSFEEEQFDLAVQGRRNPGSAFKPFGLVAELENGGSMRSFWDATSPLRLECPYVCSEDGKIWEVDNAEGAGSRLMSLYDATVASTNVVYAQLSLAVGPDKIVDVAHRMGIESDIPDVPSVVLGSGAVSPLEMASAYSSFATNGRWARPYLVSRIVDARGEVIYERGPERTQVIDPALAAAARRPLEEVPVNGTGSNANIGRTQAGKTGTHMEHRDAWYVGFVPEYTTAVWVGFPDEQRQLVNVVANGQRYDRVFGGTVPAPIWGEFMEYVLQDVPESDFPADPPGVNAYFKVPTTVVPSVVGLDQEAALTVLREARLIGNSSEVVSLEPRGTVLSQSIGAGAEVVQGTSVTIGVSTGEIPKTAMPDLRGMTVDEALAAIRDLEAETGVGALTVGVANEPVRSPKRVGIVVGTTPPPGGVIQYGGTITLVVGVLSDAPPGGGDGKGGENGDGD